MNSKSIPAITALSVAMLAGCSPATPPEPVAPDGSSTSSASLAIPAGISYWSNDYGAVMAMENAGTTSTMLFDSAYEYTCWVGELQGNRWTGQIDRRDDPQPVSYSLVLDEGDLALVGDDGGVDRYSRIHRDEVRDRLTSANPSHPGSIEPSSLCGGEAPPAEDDSGSKDGTIAPYAPGVDQWPDGTRVDFEAGAEQVFTQWHMQRAIADWYPNQASICATITYEGPLTLVQDLVDFYESTGQYFENDAFSIGFATSVLAVNQCPNAYAYVADVPRKDVH